MRLRFFLSVFLIVFAVFAVPAAAQQDGSTPVATAKANQTTPEPVLETVDNSTAIASVEVVDGTIRMVLVSEITQRIVLTDAGAVIEGGRVPQKTVLLREGRNRVSMPVTVFSHRVAVTIATRELLYAVTVRISDPLIGGPFDQQDVQVAGAAGLAAGLGCTALIAWRRVKGISRSPERLL